MYGLGDPGSRRAQREITLPGAVFNPNYNSERE